MYYSNLKADSLRLQGYDYSSDGAYFLTICSFERKNTFGTIINNEFRESALGAIIKQELLNTNNIRQNMFLRNWVIMPNHIHAILIISTNKGIEIPTYEISNYMINLNSFNSFEMQVNNLSSFVRGFKGTVSSKAKEIGVLKVWQSNFYERIIRSQSELINIENYIKDNVLNWSKDENNLSK